MNKENVENIYRLSPVQQGMLFHSLYSPHEGVYFEQFNLRFEKGFDPATFERIWQEIVSRNTILRTSFAWEGLEEPVQVVHRRVELPFEVLDWREVPAGELESKLQDHLVQERRRGFDLARPPLMRFSVLRLGDDLHHVVWSYHHAVLDGWSADLLLQEVDTLYRAAVAGRPVQAQPRRPFRDYVAWLRQQDTSQTEAYWRRVLGGFATPTPLGIDRLAGRSGGEDLGHGMEVALVPESETEALKAWARTNRLTVSTLVQGAWALVLSRYSGEDDLVYGVTVSGRPPALAGVETMLGCFINTLPVRVRVPAAERVLPWLQSLQAGQVELRRYEHSPLVQVLGWSDVPRPAPLFESIFVFEGFSGTAREGVFQRTGYPLTLIAGPDREMVLRIDYELERFEPAVIERLLGHLKSTLAAFLADPERRLEEIGILTSAELRQLETWSATGVRYGAGELLLHRIIERQAASRPDAVAVICGETSLTYGELDRQADRLAHRLRQMGAGPEVLAGVCAERSPEMVVALLAVLKAGGGYVPLDPAYPEDRLAYMLEDSGVAVLLTQQALLGRLPAHDARVVLLDGLDADGEESAGESPASGATPDNVAYMIYTSGSTGRPKGAINTHRAIVNRLLWMQDVFRLDAADRVLQKTPFSFDVSVWEFFWPLMTGACMVVAQPGGHQDPAYLVDEIARRGVTTLHFVPSMLQVFLETGGLERCSSLRRVVCSGEALPAELQRRFFELLDAPLFNLYGPTEAAVDVSWWTCEKGDGRASVPIGRPVANTALHVLDRHSRPVPVGVAGELFIGGVQVGRGYHGRPGLTAERFVPDPFARADEGPTGARLYRTGDLVRRLPDGAIEFLGRIDHQVKIRGFRIELGEIEAELAAHPSVREAVVVAAPEQRLVAYVVAAANAVVSPEGLRAHLAATLPEHMLPSAFVILEALPLSPNGKVDRRALPEPDRMASTGGIFSAPRTPAEELLAGIWSEVLKIERIGREDSFFELGGHSLLATRVLSRVRETFHVDLPLRALFEARTIAELAPRVEAARAAGDVELPPLQPSSREGLLPLSFSQERLWFLDQLEPGSDAYNVPSAVRLAGSLDAAALRRALAEVVRRHEALRTVFAVHAGRPAQVIREDLRPPLPLVDLTALPEPARDGQVRRLLAEDGRRPFDLAAGPLLRHALVRVGEEEHVVLLTFHHIVSDAGSIGTFVREVAALYAAFASGRPSPLPELPVQYADFARWQRQWLDGAVLDAWLGWWRERLAGVPVLQLPSDRPRPAMQSFRGGMCPFALGEELSTALRLLARSRGATLFMTLLAAFEALLSRHSDQEDFAVGTPMAGRDRREIEDLIGFFVNTLVLRAPLEGSPDFKALLDRVRAGALEAYAHQGVPFERIVQELAPERNLSTTPLFQVLLAFQNAPQERLELPGLTLAPITDQFSTSKFDLSLMVFDAGPRISGQWVYATALFDAATIARWEGHFQVFLEGLAAEPGRRISELPLLTQGEREQLLVDWNRPPVDHPEDGFVHELFEEQAARTPDAVALVFEGETLSYGELNARANRLSRHLRRLGAGPEVLVGISTERSFEMVVGLLAILKAGSAYVPLDPSLPAERLAFMIEDAGIELLLTREWLFPPADESPDNPAYPVFAENPAYVIYTSGSTGQPKGVVVSHGALGNRLQYARAGDVLETEVFLQKTTISFDVSVLEIFGPLVTGGRTVLARPGGQQDPVYLLDLIREQRITYASFPPSLLSVLFETEGFDECDSLRIVITGGETVPAGLPRQLYEHLPGADLLNRYGPTEATISITSWVCEREETPRTLPIGRPVAKGRVYLLDRGFQPVAAGIAGEIFLGGPCVARGYLRRPALTAGAFVPDPFSGRPGARLYRTGDLARWRPDGALEFVGRVDQQVKIRGFRVELGEIEAALARHPAVREAAVVDREDGPTRSLAAYLVLQPGSDLDEADLRSFLLASLPAYMVPADFMALDALPLSPTGKVDRKALPEPRRRGDAAGFEAPRTPAEELLAAIWADLLSLERVGVRDGFFDLGGHSLLATQVMSRVRETFGVELPLRLLFERPTVAALAAEIDAAVRAGAGLEAPPLVPVPRGGDLPLSFAQQRLWFLEQLQPGMPTYNLPTAVRFHGALDVPALHRSLREVVRRHESLRTTFAIRGGGPVQSIAPELDLHLPIIDLRGVPEDLREAAVRALATEERRRSFDLAAGPLVRATLLRSGEDEHVALLTMHHIVSDGWSMGVLVQEIAELYRALVTGSVPSLPELPLQYADFAVWQRSWLSGEVLEGQLGYWRRQLAGLPPLLELPADRPRPAVASFRGGRHRGFVPETLARGLEELCRGEGATLFMGLLAAFQSLLHLFSRQDDFAVGSPVAGRNRLETERLIGFFVNNLVLRADFSGPSRFRRLLARTREATLGAYAHQDVPFEKLVEELAGERNLSHAPLFQVALALQNTPRQALELPGTTLSWVDAEGGTSKFDITLNALEAQGGLILLWAFNRDLFDDATISRLAGQFEALLATLATDPDEELEERAILGPSERQQLLEWSSPGSGEPRGLLLHELLESQARHNPERPAVLSDQGTLSYGELNANANRLARRLRTLGVGPEVRVGLFLERSPDMVIALFAVLKAGGAYVPLDPETPADRIAWVLEDAGVPLVLTQPGLLDRLPREPGLRTLGLDGPFWDEIARESGEALRSDVGPESLAYVIYTSGSTGRPKGVLVPHRGLGNLSAAQARLFAVGEESRVLQFASISFDASVAEIAVAVRAGAALCLAPRRALLPGAELVELLRRWEVTKVTLPPAVAAALPAREIPSLRTVVVAGEACPVEVAERWSEGRLFLNAYGPTEATVCATAGAYRPGSGRLTLGRPIPGATVHVLGSGLRLVPPGIPGELCIGGVGVARGYAGRPDLTAERFVPDPFATAPGARLYRSGDLVRFLADGSLEFLGRIDQQVKIRGFRIEPGEIEGALLRHPAVREAVVAVREEGGAGPVAGRRLVAYLVPWETAGSEGVDWRSFLARELPEYMVPAAFVVLETLPRTPSGKIDRRALPAPADRAAAAGFTAPRTPLETFLADLWKQVLGVGEVGVHDDFFELGGNSITGALFINQLQEKLSEIVHVVIMFDAPTVARLAAYLREHYRDAVVRLFGAGELDAEDTRSEAPARRVDEERVAEMLRVIEPLAPRAHAGPKNPPAVFILSPPRSGSTLFRVMLAGHPELFAPPELELLSFNTLAERRAAFGDRFSFWLEGTTRAVMELQGCGAEEAETLLADWEAQGWTTQDLYRRMQEWLGDRILVDKTPSYALDPAVLERAEETFENARYIHLLRHPYGMIRSFEEAKLDQVFFRHPHAFSRRELGELIWLVSQRNILRFLERIPPERQLRLRFEDLLAEPAARLEEVCSFLGIELRPEMAAPYEDKERRMTDGIHSWSRMLGDVKFHEHSGIDSSVAEKWKSEYTEDFLGDPAWETAAALGYPRRAVQWSPLKPLDRQPGTPLPLSFGQERLWFLDQLQPGSPAYNLPASVRLRGRLDVAAFTAALREIARRHESLRTTFAVRDGRPVQVISTGSDLAVPVVDLRALPAAQREQTVRHLAGEEGRRSFDLAAGPLLRCTLLRLGTGAEGEHAALLTLHHIVSDGWSMGVLIREIATLYSAFTTGRPSPLPELPIQYADFAVWQRGWLQGEVLEAELAYWRERLTGAPPLLELPTDRPRPPVQRFRGRHHRWGISRPLTDGLAELCRRGHATLFMGLLAVFQTVLHRYTGREDVIAGTPIAGRSRRETEPLIGFFLNSLVLRTDFTGDPEVPELLARTRKITLEAFAHQDLPFEKLVEELVSERNLSHAPLFQVLLVLQNAPAEPLDLPGLTLAPVETEGTTAKFDLTLNVRETGRGLHLLWLYNRDLFDEPTIARLSGHLETLLAAAVASPERRISELPLLTLEEERQLLAWNATAAAYPADVCLHELIAAQVEKTPGRIAVTSEGEALTYRGLSAAAGRLARRLRGLGVGPEVPVGVCAERSLELVVALLAVLQAGGAYLPLDPDDPAERLEHALADSGVPVLLTQERLLGRLPAHGARTVLIDDAAVEKGGGAPPPPARASGVGPGNLAYVIYTSGSTGRPKGTMNTHRGIVNRLLWMQETYGLGADDRVLQKTPFSFDVSVWEFFWPLLTGARLVMARPGGHKDSAYLVRTIAEEEITTLHFVPSMLQVFLEAPGVEGCASLRRVICSGEALPADLERRFFSRLGARLDNLYGPTEAAVDVTWWTCEREGRRGVVPIGHPVANTQIRLLDASLHQVPVGVPGELHIGGVQVGRGYWSRPDLTAERFIPDPFSPEPGARLYKTGDLARRLPDGAVDFLGRIDHQVKVRGLRIELGEIEVALAAQPAVREAVVLARRPEGSAGTIGLMGTTELVAYVIPAATGNGAAPAPTLAVLREALARSLPEHMLPTALVVLDAFPLTSSGKTDRRALSRIAPERTAGAPGERVAPRTELERFLAGLWSETLGGLPAESFGVHDSFFDLGGNSITGAILVNRLQKALGEIVHVVAIFDTPTIAGLAAWLAGEYPQAVARIWGAESLGDAGRAGEFEDTRPVDEERLEEVRRLIRSLAPDHPLGSRNPPAVFVLSPPRSGSTLLRVMLGGNPRLFAPPELELLNFHTLAERRDAFPGRDAFRLEGLLRAVMEVRACGPDEAREIVAGFTEEGMTTRELYRTLQEWIGDRLLVDKTPTYAWDPVALRRAEETFEDARYIHLVRHPYGMIHSFEEARIDQIFFHEDHPFTRRELAEALWVIAHRHILDLLAEVPGERQITVRFEDLLADPESELRRICGTLGVDYHPDMAVPYQEKGARMTDGLHAESRMLGDVKFHEHKGVERGVAERWRESYRRDFLGDVTWNLAARLGFDVERERVGAPQIPSSLVKLRPGTTKPPLFLVHPVSGELLLYRHLVNALGPDREVYGFQAQGFQEGEQPLETVEEMADLYVQALVAVQPAGPCLLAGSSMGGLLAFEMARRLRALGREVALTALLDAPDPAVMARETRDAEGEAELDILRHATGGKASLALEDLRGLTSEQRLDLLLEKGREAGGFGAGIGTAELRRLVRLVEANRRALTAYHPEPADLRILYLRAAQGVRADAAWEPLALGGVEVHEVPGSHLSMHLPPHAGELAEILRRSIGERLEEAPEDEPAVAVADAGKEVEVGELGLES